MNNALSARVAALGYTLETAAAPAANYVSRLRIGDLLFISGQIPRRDGQPACLGVVGATLSEQEGQAAAALAALGVLAQLRDEVADDLTRVARIARLGVFVASSADFTRHSAVANGASDLFVAVFGAAGRHARTAVGVASLPMGVAVEVEAIVALREPEQS